MSELLIVLGVYLLLECIWSSLHVDRKHRPCTLGKMILTVITALNSIDHGLDILHIKAHISWPLAIAVVALVLMWLPVTYYRFANHYDRRGI